eukprot:294289_1
MATIHVRSATYGNLQQPGTTHPCSYFAKNSTGGVGSAALSSSVKKYDVVSMKTGDQTENVSEIESILETHELADGTRIMLVKFVGLSGLWCEWVAESDLKL